MGRCASAAAVVRCASAALAAALLLPGCQSGTPPSGAAPPTGASPTAATAGLPALAGDVPYDVDGAASEVLLFLGRDGPMAALGHSHVIAVRGLQGRVLWQDDVARSRFALEFAASGLSVDEPALRQQAGGEFAGELDQAARDGTRANMLGAQVLQAAEFPVIRLRSSRVERLDAGTLRVQTAMTIRGRESTIPVPVRWQRNGAELVASGEFAVLQTALGLTPHSAALGALRVADEMKIRFRIVARRAQ